MDKLISSLTNLGYEFFGVLLPGFATTIALLAMWYIAGDIPTLLSDGDIPPLTLAAIDMGLNEHGAAIVVMLVCLSYFLGHSLKWASRGGRQLSRNNAWTRLICTLKFRPPRPAQSYHEGLSNLLPPIASFYGKPSGTELEWRALYQIGKTRILQSGKSSLLPTYQSKYTLHRSLAVMAAAMFWLTVAIGVAGMVLAFASASSSPRWGLLPLSIVMSVGGMHGFGASYEYTWKLWGDSVIGEAYALELLPQPQVATSPKEEKRNES